MKIPSYEDYQKATAFARFRYRFNSVVLVLCWLFIIYIIYFMVTNIDELKADPLQYGCEKMKIECHCYRPNDNTIGMNIDFYVNATDKWIVVNATDKWIVQEKQLQTYSFGDINFTK